MCVTDPWAHMSLVHSILSLKLGVTHFLAVAKRTHKGALATATKLRATIGEAEQDLARLLVKLNII